MPSPTRFLPMLRLNMDRQQPDRHLLPEIHALFLNPLPLLVARTRSCHLSPVCHLQLHSCRLERVSDHSGCLPNVSLQAHPVEQLYQGAEAPLEPSWVRWRDHTIIRVEDEILVSHLLSAPAPLVRALQNNCDPISHHRIHHHVEYGGR